MPKKIIVNVVVSYALKKSNFNKHLFTRKHQNTYNTYTPIEKKNNYFSQKFFRKSFLDIFKMSIFGLLKIKWEKT